MSHRFIRFSLEALGFLILFGWAMMFVAPTADAATKAEKTKSAEQLVSEALHREIYGQGEQRHALLQKALTELSDCKQALWHSGHVQYNRKWFKADEIPDIAVKNNKLTRYQSQRDEIPNTLEGHLALANWCHEHHLDQQERAHLTKVLEFEPDHAEARRRLGFVRVSDDWMTRDEIIEERTRVEQERSAVAQRRPKLEKLRDNYVAGSPKQKEFAAAQLRAITDAAAIPAIEAVLSFGQGEKVSQLAVEIISNINGNDATISLARHAVFAEFESVRKAAAHKLQDRPQGDYIPSILALMRTPIETQREVLQGRGGRLIYRHAFYREGQEEREVSVLDTNYERAAVPGGDRRDTLRRALTDVRDRAQNRERAVAAENQQTVDLNRRAMAALEMATGKNVFNSPQQWWTWWNEHNEVYVSAYKPLDENYRREEVTIVDRSSIPPGLISGFSGTGGGGGSYDCLAEGTIVWTETGPRAIEKILVGDLVLSQDPETGELTYKPVLATTVRPPSELTKIHVNSEEIVTSGGHLFWVSGQGWVKSRHVKGGAQLHGVGGAATVSVVDKAAQEQTYNLVVGDFHTYFVGASKVLCHDNTVRRPTDSVVPGLAAE